MKVCCDRVTNSRGIPILDSIGNPAKRSHLLTVGNEYHVLALCMTINGNWLVRIITDSSGQCGLFPLIDFKIISAKVSISWIAHWGVDGFFELSPEKWTAQGFWDRFYDRDSDAIKIFEEEKQKIIEADP